MFLNAKARCACNTVITINLLINSLARANNAGLSTAHAAAADTWLPNQAFVACVDWESIPEKVKK